MKNWSDKLKNIPVIIISSNTNIKPAYGLLKLAIIIEVNIVTIDGSNGGPKAYKPISVDARTTEVRKKDVFFVGFSLYSFRSWIEANWTVSQVDGSGPVYGRKRSYTTVFC